MPGNLRKMNNRYEFNLTPAYCLYNGAAVLEQDGARIRFLVADENDEVLKGRLSRAFERHVQSIRKIKNSPESFRTIIKIEFEKGNRERLKKCISMLYRTEESVLPEIVENEEFEKQKEAAAVLLLDSILNEARQRNATDIHIEKNCIRLRVNGLLEKLMELQSEKGTELVQRIKLLAGMNVLEKRKSQDGHFIYGNKNPFFLRVSTMPVVTGKYSGKAVSSSSSGNKSPVNYANYGDYSGGESVVIRILDTSRIPLSIDSLGFNLDQLEKLCGKNGLINFANGLVLVCGPTGSGKSTTVAALLVEIEKISAGALKIMSLEDPPEYMIPGVTQIKVDERYGFSDVLNHIFRQDPDVVMIGEIRDEESAAAALRASLTGHLVFATIHSGGAAESILRLENLGIDRTLLCQILRGVVCQELCEINGKIKLYADVALPQEKLHVEAVKTFSEEQLENLFEHETNFKQFFSQAVSALELERKRQLPLFRWRKNNEGIHKSIV